MSVEDFMKTVAPELLKDFPHIIPERFLALKLRTAPNPGRNHTKTAYVMPSWAE